MSRRDSKKDINVQNYLFVYISVENPRGYGDYEIKDALNQRAYDLVLRERIESKQPFWVVNVAVINEDLKGKAIRIAKIAYLLSGEYEGWNDVEQIQRQIYR